MVIEHEMKDLLSEREMKACYGLNVCAPLPIIHHWSPNPQCGYIWRWYTKEIIKVKWGHKVGPWCTRISVLLRRDTRELSLPPHVNKPRNSHVRTPKEAHLLQVRKRSFTRNRRCQNLFWTSSLQNCEKISICAPQPWHPTQPVIRYDSLTSLIQEGKRTKVKAKNYEPKQEYRFMWIIYRSQSLENVFLRLSY